MKPNGRAYTNGAYALHFLNRFEDAIMYLERALEYEPDHIVIMTNIGLELGNLDRVEEAIEYYDRVLEIDPEVRFALVERTGWYARRGDCRKAEGDLQTLRSLGFSGAPAAEHNLVQIQVGFLYRGCPQLFDGEWTLEHTRIERRWDEDQEAFGDYQGASFRRGVTLYRMGRYEEAGPLLVTANGENDDWTKLLASFFLAMDAHQLGRTSESRAYYEQASEAMKLPTNRNNPRLKDLQLEARQLLGMDSP